MCPGGWCCVYMWHTRVYPAPLWVYAWYTGPGVPCRPQSVCVRGEEYHWNIYMQPRPDSTPVCNNSMNIKQPLHIDSILGQRRRRWPNMEPICSGRLYHIFYLVFILQRRHVTKLANYQIYRTVLYLNKLVITNTNIKCLAFLGLILSQCRRLVVFWKTWYHNFTVPFIICEVFLPIICTFSVGHRYFLCGRCGGALHHTFTI